MKEVFVSIFDLDESVSYMRTRNIETLGLSEKNIKLYKGLGINTLEDLLKCNSGYLKKLGLTYFGVVSKAIHDLGICFVDEIDINIVSDYLKEHFSEDEILNLRVQNMCISPKIYGILDFNSVHNLGGLVTRTPKEIMQLRNVGEEAYKEIQAIISTYNINVPFKEEYVDEVLLNEIKGLEKALAIKQREMIHRAREKA